MYFKKFFFGIYTIIRSIYMVGMQSFNKRETIMYPDVPIKPSYRFRGRIVLTKNPDGTERCVACNLCSSVCPVDCIVLQKGEKNGRWYAKFFRINFSRCIFCGMCEEACPTMAIQLTTDFEMGEYKRKDLVYEKEDLLISSTGKYPEYNFYHISGIDLSNKNKNEIKRKSKKVDVKSLLP